MTVDELQRARITLGPVLRQHDENGCARGTSARRRVGARLEKLLRNPVGSLPAPPAPAPRLAPSGVPLSGSRPARHPVARSSNGSRLGGGLVLLLVVGGIAYSCSKDDSSGAFDSASSDGSSAANSSSEGTRAPKAVGLGQRKGFAWEACKDAVTNELKAPATADFESVFGARFAAAADDIVVVGAYVDSGSGPSFAPTGPAPLTSHPGPRMSSLRR
jgi:hypothetical protein